MRLRRTFAAAAATAALVPAALLSATAAQAEPNATDTATVTAAPTATTDGTAAATATATETATTTDTPSATATDTPTTAGTPTATDTPTTPATSATPTPSATPCPVDDGSDAALSLSVTGLPSKIAAGSGWHTFQMTASNTSDKALGTVNWLSAVDNDTNSDNPKDWLGTYAHLQFFDPASKTWQSMEDLVGTGVFFGATDLGAHATIDIQMRLSIDPKAPVGDGFAIGLGGYTDDAKCDHTAYSEYDFKVLAPGKSAGNPGDATGTSAPAPVGKKPQGGITNLPATGSLAETGASSALPTIALSGGAAVVLGAGAMFIVRRRKSGSAA